MPKRVRTFSRKWPWVAVILALLIGLVSLVRSGVLSQAVAIWKFQAETCAQQSEALKARVIQLESQLGQASDAVGAGQRAPDYPWYFETLKKDESVPKDAMELFADVEAPTFANKGDVISPEAKFLYKIRTHDGFGWILVYGHGDVQIVHLDSRTGIGYLVGNSRVVSYDGNSGGMWFPVGITGNDASLVMYAVMGAPGAGGSLIQYGTDLLPIKPMDFSREFIWTGRDQLPGKAMDLKFSYDSVSKSVYVAEGMKTPHYSKPGSGNSGAIRYRDLLTDVSRTILEETDTSYELRSIDPTARTLTFIATTWKFTSACPRGNPEDSADTSLDCAVFGARATSTIPLP